MKYIKAQRRIQELNDIGNLLGKQGFVGTKWKIWVLSLLINGEFDHDLVFEEYMNTLNYFAEEFKNEREIGQSYRWGCFKEIGDLQHELIDRVKPEQYKIYFRSLNPLLANALNCRKTVQEIKQTLNEGNLNKRTRFHISCYAYLIMVEGVFDELVRSFYFLNSLNKGEKPNIDEVKNLDVYTIYDLMEPKPLILKNWTDKKHIRNAIGHATAYYHESKNEVRFVDAFGKRKYDKTISWEEYEELMVELESAVSAYLFFIFFLRIKDLVLAEDEENLW